MHWESKIYSHYSAPLVGSPSSPLCWMLVGSILTMGTTPSVLTAFWLISCATFWVRWAWTAGVCRQCCDPSTCIKRLYTTHFSPSWLCSLYIFKFCFTRFLCEITCLRIMVDYRYNSRISQYKLTWRWTFTTCWNCCVRSCPFPRTLSKLMLLCW